MTRAFSLKLLLLAITVHLADGTQMLLSSIPGSNMELLATGCNIFSGNQAVRLFTLQQFEPTSLVRWLHLLLLGKTQQTIRIT